MIRMALAVTALGFAGACSAQPGRAPATNATAPDAQPAAAQPVTLTAKDGVKVFGAYYEAKSPKALILLFHQAGSSKDEYATIAPRLVQAGYSALAIDQRSGGPLYGANETAAALGDAAEALNGDAGYMKALPDLQAALDWAETKQLPIILWGSSYSSSLIFPLAVANPGKVKALLAFSPGEYFDDKTLVERAAADVHVPVLIVSTDSKEEVGLADAILHALPAEERNRLVPPDGVHGSSTLIATKNPKGAESNWTVVLGFLKRVAS